MAARSGDPHVAVRRWFAPLAGAYTGNHESHLIAARRTGGPSPLTMRTPLP